MKQLLKKITIHFVIFAFLALLKSSIAYLTKTLVYVSYVRNASKRIIKKLFGFFENKRNITKHILYNQTIGSKSCNIEMHSLVSRCFLDKHLIIKVGHTELK